MKTPQEILGTHWTARKDYNEARRIWANYVAGTELADVFRSDDIWAEVQTELYKRHGLVPGVHRLQCSIREMVRLYIGRGQMHNLQIVMEAVRSGKLKFALPPSLTDFLIEKKRKEVDADRERQKRARRMQRQVRRSAYRDPTVSQRELNEE